MKYQRLKTIDGNGSTLRYFPLAEGEEAVDNRFYEIINGQAVIIPVGEEPQAGNLIGFSHGGDKLAKGLIFLEISAETLYMCICEEGDTDRPAIGSTVDGFLKVIDTHYTEDGKNEDGFGIETLNLPYYLASIGTGGYGKVADATIIDDDATLTITIKNGSSPVATVTAVPIEGNTETATLNEDGTYELLQKIKSGDAISTVYASITIAWTNGDSQTVDVSTTIDYSQEYTFTTFTIG